MAKSAFEMSDAVAPLLIRIPLGVIMLAHGSQKLFGLFGGSGLTSTFQIFEKNLGIPPIFTLMAIIAEFGGGLGIMSGFLTRLSATGIATVMSVAIYKVHWVNGFFMNTNCMPGKGHGIEFTLSLLAMSLYLMLAGGGKWCIDRIIFRN